MKNLLFTSVARLHLRKIFRIGGFVALVLAMITFIDVAFVSDAFAQTGDAAQPTNDHDSATSELMRNVVAVLNLVHAVLALLTAPLVVLAGWLISPDWTFGDFFGLRPHLYNVWVLVSNIVYVIFAIALLFLAVMNVFGKDDGNFTLKAKLPKFILGIILVPFTWWFVSFTVSMVNYATAAVLTLPKAIVTENTEWWDTPAIPKVIDISGGDTASGNVGTIEQVKCAENPGSCISPGDFIRNLEGGEFYIIMIYAFDIFKIQNLDKLSGSAVCDSSTDAGCIRTIFGVAKTFLFHALFAVIFAVLLVALCVALLARAIMLWVFAILSPSFALMLFLGDKTPSQVQDKFSFKEFIKLAMVPFLAASVLSFGLLMLATVNAGNSSDDEISQGAVFEAVGSGDRQCTKRGSWIVQICYNSGTDGKYETDVIIGGNGSGTGEDSITLKFGDAFSELLSEPAVGGAVDTAVTTTRDIFSHVIMNLIALVIIWIGVIAALKYQKVTDKVIQPFEQFGNSVAKGISELPKLIPIGPGGTSVDSIGRSAELVRSAMRQTSAEQAQKDADKFTRAFGIGELSQERKDLETASRNATTVSRENNNKLIEAAKGLARKEGSFESSAMAKEREQLIDGLAKAAGIPDKTDAILEKMKGQWGASNFGKQLIQAIKDENGTLSIRNFEGFENDEQLVRELDKIARPSRGDADSPSKQPDAQGQARVDVGGEQLIGKKRGDGQDFVDEDGKKLADVRVTTANNITTVNVTKGEADGDGTKTAKILEALKTQQREADGIDNLDKANAAADAINRITGKSAVNRIRDEDIKTNGEIDATKRDAAVEKLKKAIQGLQIS